MKERPILFSAPMVRALLDGSKTQTRRVIKSNFLNTDGEIYEGHINGPELYEPAGYDKHGDMIPMPEVYGIYDEDGEFGMACPYGKPGDQLWVKETHAFVGNSDPGYLVFAATYPSCLPSDVTNIPKNIKEAGYKWKPSIFMRREYSRIQLEIISIRVERLNDCSEEDARAEGCITELIKSDYDGSMIHVPKEIPDESGMCMVGWDNCKDWYADLWDSINGQDSWDKNPWVWVVEFRKI